MGKQWLTDKYSGSRKTGFQQEESYDVWSVQRVYRKGAALRPLVAYWKRETVSLQREVAWWVLEEVQCSWRKEKLSPVQLVSPLTVSR